MWWRWYTAPAGSVVGTGLVSGLVFGLVFGVQTADTRARLVRALPPGATPQQVRAAVRASRRGRVPDDPVVRVVTVVLLRQRVAGVLGSRRSSVVVGAVGTVVGVVLARSPSTAMPSTRSSWSGVEQLPVEMRDPSRTTSSISTSARGDRGEDAAEPEGQHDEHEDRTAADGVVHAPHDGRGRVRSRRHGRRAAGAPAAGRRLQRLTA